MMSTNTADNKQQRAIFFVFDGGTGLGHLRRLARIAKELQGQFACLIVTGHRAAAHWFVPEECEYVHLPSWDSLLAPKSQYWARKPFLLLNEEDAIRLRRRILAGVVEAFQPDAIFVDHLPLGSREELEEIISGTRCLKYLVTRGILNETENLRQLILGGKAHHYLKSHYDRILVASDRKVFDFSKQYNIPSDLVEKTVHTGYVAECVSGDVIKMTREDRGITNGDTWVVASAGGGQLGEGLIKGSLELAAANRDIKFDIVMGPRSGLRWNGSHRTVIDRDNVRLHKEVAEMPYLHASADLVISSGGYNSLLESLQGNARILCFPFRSDRRDEQFRYASRLKKFVDIEVSTDLSELPNFFQRAVSSFGRPPRDRRRELDLGGALYVKNIVLNDLGLNERAVAACSQNIEGLDEVS